MHDPQHWNDLVARARLRDFPTYEHADADAFTSAAVDEIESLRDAVDHRTVIGQATGILMERFGLDADTAFATLAQHSQETNRKLYDIAVELAHEARAPAAVPDPDAAGLDITTPSADTPPRDGTQQTG